MDKKDIFIHKQNEMIKLKKLLNEGKNDYFGMKKSEYDALLNASERKRYKPAPDKIKTLMSKYPKLDREMATIALKLYNSPARNSFTAMDVISYIKKL